VDPKRATGFRIHFLWCLWFLKSEYYTASEQRRVSAGIHHRDSKDSRYARKRWSSRRDVAGISRTREYEDISTWAKSMAEKPIYILGGLGSSSAIRRTGEELEWYDISRADVAEL
jgi:hypothetical protein